jgi:hypothetical protein
MEKCALPTRIIFPAKNRLAPALQMAEVTRRVVFYSIFYHHHHHSQRAVNNNNMPAMHRLFALATLLFFSLSFFPSPRTTFCEFGIHDARLATLALSGYISERFFVC